jgi:hypothetical protein
VVGPHHFKQEYKEIYHLASYTGKYLFGTVIIYKIYKNFRLFEIVYLFRHFRERKRKGKYILVKNNQGQ